MSIQAEKRRAERYAVHRGSVANINGQEAYSTITDVSETGIGFICSPQLHNGDKVDLALEYKMGNTTKVFHVIVEVVRYLKEDFEYYAGAVVKTMTEEFKQYLEQIKLSRQRLAM